MSKTRVHRVWSAMIERCENRNNKGYANYGGRGIKVCERWRSSFENFLADMGPRPSGMTIERKDTNGDYEPLNCCWATYREQQNNRTNNRRITFRGETMTLQQWARATGISHATIQCRLDRYGWSIDEALTLPPSPIDRNYR